jgi:hypothetical protein
MKNFLYQKIYILIKLFNKNYHFLLKIIQKKFKKLNNPTLFKFSILLSFRISDHLSAIFPNYVIIMDDLVRRIGRLRMKVPNSSSEDSDSDSYESRYSDRKMFGYYKCEECKRHWQSAHSWRGFGQKCKGCGKNTFPFKQEKLIRSEENKIDVNKPHEKHLCQKCKQVGDCTIKNRHWD